MLLPVKASEPPKVMAVPPATVAGAEMMTEEVPEIAVTIAPVGIPVPLTGWPTAMPSTVPTVRVLLPNTVVEVAGVANVRFTAAAAVAPELLIPRFPSVLLPQRVSVAPPFRVTGAVFLIWAGAVSWTVALLMTSVPGIATRLVPLAARLLRVRLPALTKVVPEYVLVPLRVSVLAPPLERDKAPVPLSTILLEMVPVLFRYGYSVEAVLSAPAVRLPPEMTLAAPLRSSPPEAMFRVAPALSVRAETAVTRSELMVRLVIPVVPAASVMLSVAPPLISRALE